MKTSGAMRKVTATDLRAMAHQSRLDAELYPTTSHGVEVEPPDCTCLRCCCFVAARIWDGMASRTTPTWIAWGKRSKAFLARARRNYARANQFPREKGER